MVMRVFISCNFRMMGFDIPNLTREVPAFAVPHFPCLATAKPTPSFL